MTPQPVSSIPPPDDSDGMPPIDLYRLAVEEYRFQVQFNWERTRYLLVFSAGVLAVGGALSSQDKNVFAVPVFSLGVVVCILAAATTRIQHGYYRAARDRMRAIEKAQRLETPYAIDTTATLGRRVRKASVTDLVYVLLVAIAIADIAGGVLVFAT